MEAYSYMHSKAFPNNSSKVIYYKGIPVTEDLNFI